MHVLITADTVGGVWTYARELVTGLARRGVRVTLVSFGGVPASADTLWLDGLPGMDYRPTAFRLEWMQDSEADLEASAEYLDSLIREVNPELLHLNQYFYGSLPCAVPRLVVAHSDVVSWWLAVHGEPPPDSPWLRWYRAIVTSGLDRANAVVAPSRWMMGNLAAHYVRPQRASVIHNGRSPALFHPRAQKEDCMVSVGRLWDSGKQVNLLLEHDLPLTTYVVGSEVHPDVAFRAAAGFGSVARSALRFPGPQSEPQLAQLLGRASLYAATSRYEPFGLAPLEAALSRCALVANDIPAFREIWGDTAVYFAANDSASLARTVSWLHRDRRFREKCAARAYEHALQHYSADRMVEDYLALYRALIAAEAAAA